MKEFHQHPDGLIFVRGSQSTYQDTRENFVKDFGLQIPELPEGANEQIYTRGKRHAFMGDGNIVLGGPPDCVECNTILDRLEQGLAAQKLRRETAEREESERLQAAHIDVPDDMEMLVDTLVAEGIIPSEKSARIVSGLQARRESARQVVRENYERLEKLK